MRSSFVTRCAIAAPIVLTALAAPGVASAQSFSATHTYTGVMPTQGAPTSRDFVNGTVHTSMLLASSAGSFISMGPVNAASPGVTLAPENANSPQLEDVRITVAVSTLNATQRQVVITWDTPSMLPFFAAGTQLGGAPVIQIGFNFGMDMFGAFPGAAMNPFEDPDFVSVTSVTGALFNSSGTQLASFGISTANYVGGWGGRSFIGAGGADLGSFAIQKFTSTVIYEYIPAPGATSVMCLAGLLATRRRR